jgi:hypothetical protein
MERSLVGQSAGARQQNRVSSGSIYIGVEGPARPPSGEFFDEAVVRLKKIDLGPLLTATCNRTTSRSTLKLGMERQSSTAAKTR